MKKNISALLIGCLPACFLQAQEIIKPNIKGESSFAIVVDAQTYQAASSEIQAYQHSVESDGLPTYILYKDWERPEEIKDLLFSLYQDASLPLEGAVFIGDIPVPMVRGAQQLTSAFKMPESLAWQRSSVPSDRFYDDFDLKFEFLKQDSIQANYFYYRLDPQSPHYLEMDIYTGRIKPPTGSKAAPADQQIKDYLKKLVEVRKETNPLNNLLVSKGHGYNSNSMMSTGHEMMAIRSTFPQLFTPGHSVQFLNYRNADFLKNPLLTELKKADADFAYMTGHGTPDLQLLNGYPDVSNPQPSMENVARYIRSKMIAAKERGRDLEEVKAGFQASLGLNDKWFEDAFDADRAIEDSVFNQNMDIHMEDLDQVHVRVAYINSCLTGSFHLDDYLAAHYPFSNGKNVVAIANTVGVLQDLWGSQLLGIFQHGVRVGHWLKKTAYLETHIFGDPTYHFSNAVDYNSLFAQQQSRVEDWTPLMESGDADLMAYALIELKKLEDEETFSKRALDIYKSSPLESVRTQAYYLLRAYNNTYFKEALDLALNDTYEYIKRKAVYDAQDLGTDHYIDALVDLYIHDQALERVQYKITWAMQFLNQDLLKKRLNAKLNNNNTSVFNAQELLDNALNRVESNQKRGTDVLKALQDSTLSDKELSGRLRTLRLYRYHTAVPYIIDIVNDTKRSEAVRLAAIEVLSWYGLSYQRNHILEACAQWQNDASNAVQYQAIKTAQLIQDAPRRPF